MGLLYHGIEISSSYLKIILLGNEFFTSYSKQSFTLYGKEIFTLYGKQFFTLPGREFFTSLPGSRLSRQVLCQLKISGCLRR